MKVLKRFFAILLVVVLVLGMVALHLMRKEKEHQLSVSIQSTQESIRALEAEKLELEAKLTDITSGNLDTANDDDEQEADPTRSMEAVLCVANVTETFYQEIFPAMQENGQTGIIILRNGRLPGDVTDDIISVNSFVDMINSGWSYAITVTQAVGSSTESWRSEIDQYVDRLAARVSSTPSMYCFVNGTSEARLNILKEEGFETILCHSAVEDEELKVIQLLPYNSDSLTETMTQMDGYCGLEVWASWQADTDENLRYSWDKTSELLESTSIKLTGLDELQSLTPLPDSDEEEQQVDLTEYTTEDQIRARIAEIDAEIETLYRS